MQIRRRGRPSLSEVLETLDEEVLLLRTRLGGLPRAVEADHILRQIWIDDVHNSTAIEGNTMTRDQVKLLVDQRRASATLVEAMEVEGYARAADWAYRTAPDYESVPTAVVAELHRRAVALAWAIHPPATDDLAGDWRKSGVSVRQVSPSLPVSIAADLSAWSASTAKLAGNHPVAHAAIHHAWLERIHPFVDGNGRVGRLVLTFMLLQHGYPPAVIQKSQRSQYLKALALADGGNSSPLTEVVARAVSGALGRFLIPNLAGAAKLVPLSALAANSNYSVVYLRQLARSGRLKAIQEGRLWLSSRAWLKEYVKHRDARGGSRHR